MEPNFDEYGMLPGFYLARWNLKTISGPVLVHVTEELFVDNSEGRLTRVCRVPGNEFDFSVDCFSNWNSIPVPKDDD